MNRICLITFTILALMAGSAAAQAPEAAHIYPTDAMNDGPITVHIYGAELQGPPVTVADLVRSGCPSIVGGALDVTSDVHMTCSLDLTGAQTGLYDLVLENGQGSDTLRGSFTVYSSSPTPYVWDRTTVGTALTMLGVALGDGNRDGETEVYGSCTDGAIYQYKWNGVSWAMMPLGYGGQYMYSVAVGDGNGDGETEVYGSNADGRIYQFKWDGSSWDKRIVGAGADYMYAVAVGDGNSDGGIEVYGANLDGSIYQFKWDGANWQNEIVGNGGSLMYGVDVEDGNNDEELEVYGSNGDMNIYQFKWTGTEWERTTVGAGGLDMREVQVGDGNGDGEREVYGANWDSNIYQFRNIGGTWTKTTVGTGMGMMYGVAVGNGNGDSEVEVYGANQDDKVYEYWWDGGGWQDFTVGLGSIMMYGVAVGDGNNDGEMEVYGADWDGKVYQFKPIEVGVEEEVSSRVPFFFGPRANPSREGALFELVTPGAGLVTLSIYDMTGRLMDTPLAGWVPPGKRQIHWMTDAPSGVYFYQLESPWGAQTGKLVLLR